ncbi:unnamed protein product [Rotaria magnacalcarata]|uniref:AAA+ ATPase domain-containing protein n=1 Tax=Rotaria magnacalcarata TaxID=392030 RepID=A0A815I6I6_9BILA|nr:unnamed protein product [Rotaria magnacalcarata]
MFLYICVAFGLICFILNFLCGRSESSLGSNTRTFCDSRKPLVSASSSDQHEQRRPKVSFSKWIEKSWTGKFSYEIYLSYILAWKPIWLDNASLTPGVLYKDYCVDNRLPIPLKNQYESFSDYESAHLPWLLEETWENIKRDDQQNFEEKNSQSSAVFDLYVCSKEEQPRLGLMMLYCQILVDKDDQTLPKVDDLLLVTTSLNRQTFGLQRDKKHVFKLHLLHPALVTDPRLHTKPAKAICSELLIYISLKYAPFITGSNMQVQVITSLISNLRRFRTLASLHSFPIVSDLLSLGVNDNLFSLNSSHVQQPDVMSGEAKNEMQDRVINEAVSIVCQSNRYRPRVYIVQGPPGTGKSHTIVSIIHSINQRCNPILRSKKLRILVCAPSNAACDELRRKISNQYGLNIIRVGHEIYSSKQASYREQRELEQGKLAEADVVFSTLNYVGNSIFDSFGSDTNQSPWFDCLIVDEAGQCLEIDTFIPLRLRIPCMLLFGDPEQLPATVLSQRAQNANFGQSLLARLYSLFKSTDLIRMLNIQYRMAEPICRFPSAHIYNGELLNDPSTQEERAGFRLKPYAFINVLNSQAQQDVVSQSYFNRAEAECIVELVHYLTRRVSIQLSSIGVITPYRAQLALISNKISPRLDIATVDGFQGREKDVILISTVRADAEELGGHSLGFVADRRRLNVALTRGKYAVYIVGHAKSLTINDDWRLLIQDARRRQCIFNYKTRSNFYWLHCKKKGRIVNACP